MNIDILKRAMVLCASIVLSFSAYAQQDGPAEEVRFRYPLEVPMNLSGNYGELRPNHFHSGIDFRVGGVVGAPIYAAESGYVSRISVSPSGYGNALYITHANGYTTVYGHMLCFADRIAEYVREAQYREESFRQDIALGPDVFPVEKGEQIGKAGNTGSSGGPHLHFEIRDCNNVPLNVFAHGFLHIEDHLPPVFNNVVFYGLEQKFGFTHNYYIGYPKNGYISLPEKSYVCIDAVDKQDDTYAKLAVNEYKVWLDNEPIYHLTIGDVPFEMGRDINSLMEYRQRVMRRRNFIKSFVEPANSLQDRVRAKDGGIIHLKDNREHKVKIEVLDYAGNRAVRTYTVRRNDALYPERLQDTVKGSYAAWFLPAVYRTDGFGIYLPQASLYSSLYLQVDTLDRRVTPFSPVWTVNTDRIALKKAVSVAVECQVPDSLIGKAFLAFVYNKGAMGYAGRDYDPQTREMKAQVLSLGKFTVAVDLKAPEIIPDFQNNAVIKGSSLVCRIKDNLSGIRSYRVEIDGHWSLAEFDAKTRRLIVPLEHAAIGRGEQHEYVVKVVDNVGNEAVLKRVFTW